MTYHTLSPDLEVMPFDEGTLEQDVLDFLSVNNVKYSYFHLNKQYLIVQPENAEPLIITRGMNIVVAVDGTIFGVASSLLNVFYTPLVKDSVPNE